MCSGLLRSAGVCRSLVVLRPEGFSRGLLRSTGVCRGLIGSAVVFGSLQESTGFLSDLQGSAEAC